MQSDAVPATVDDYFASLPDDRKAPTNAIRETLLANLPPGFEERMQYSMPAWVVPLATYPAGYHTARDTPLPFIALASQKTGISLYHMGLYADDELLGWFRDAYAAANVGRLDLGKSCIRFKNVNKIPFEVIGELAAKLTPEEWVAAYERSRAAQKTR